MAALRHTIGWGIIVALAAVLPGCWQSRELEGEAECGDQRVDGCPVLDPSEPGCSPTCTGLVEEGDACEYPSGRCWCTGFGWQCEPLECPLPPYAAGERCDVPGVGPCTYAPGVRLRCVAPERVWVACDVLAGSWGRFCPRERPEVGSPCCITVAEDRCDYPEGTLACVDDHWVEVDEDAP